jgi:hypothetical protein
MLYVQQARYRDVRNFSEGMLTSPFRLCILNNSKMDGFSRKFILESIYVAFEFCLKIRKMGTACNDLKTI